MELYLDARIQDHTHTVTPPNPSLSVSVSVSLCLSLSLSLSLSHSSFSPHPLSLFYSLSHPSISPSHSFSLPHSFFLSLRLTPPYLPSFIYSVRKPVTRATALCLCVIFLGFTDRRSTKTMYLCTRTSQAEPWSLSGSTTPHWREQQTTGATVMKPAGGLVPSINDSHT